MWFEKDTLSLRLVAFASLIYSLYIYCRSDLDLLPVVWQLYDSWIDSQMPSIFCGHSFYS